MALRILHWFGLAGSEGQIKSSLVALNPIQYMIAKAEGSTACDALTYTVILYHKVVYPRVRSTNCIWATSLVRGFLVSKIAYETFVSLASHLMQVPTAGTYCRNLLYPYSY